MFVIKCRICCRCWLVFGDEKTTRIQEKKANSEERLGLQRYSMADSGGELLAEAEERRPGQGD